MKMVTVFIHTDKHTYLFLYIAIIEFEYFGTHMHVDWKNTQIKSWIKMDTTRKSTQEVAVFVKPTCKFKWATCKHPIFNWIPLHNINCAHLCTDQLFKFKLIFFVHASAARPATKTLSIYGVHYTCMRYISFPCKANPNKQFVIGNTTQ